MPAAAAAKLYHPSQRVSNKICDEIKSIIPLSCQVRHARAAFGALPPPPGLSVAAPAAATPRG